jgi:opacity protein-like surface antigen
MKKLSHFLFLIAVFATTAFPFRMGMEFSVSQQATVGLNLRLTEKFELKPQLGFGFAEDNNSFILTVDGNFYLPQMQNLQHYAGPGISFSAYSDDTYFNINGHYGLRYDFNDVISTFGEIGIGLTFDPFMMNTFKGGLGLTFYFPGIK